MGCAREGYDLFKKVGRYHFIKNKIWKRPDMWKLVFEDTFCQIICKIIGHNTYYSDEDYLACKRCHKFIKRIK